MRFVPWASDLPAEWSVVPLRSVADYAISSVDKLSSDDELPVRLCNYTDVYNQEFITPDLDFMAATATLDEIKRFRLQRNDVLITKDSESWDDIGVPAVVRETADDLVCGYHLALIRPRLDALDGNFLFRSLQSKPVRVQLELAANGITRFGIPKSTIGSAAIPLPPPEVQRSIVAFLDRETARLDALIGAKERMLRLLDEKRRALITCAVTRSIDPDVQMRDSGVPWLGEVPAHWDVVPLRFLVTIFSGATPDTGNREYWNGTIPWVSPKDMKREEIDDAEDHVSPAALSVGALQLIPAGAVLIVVRGMILAHSFPTAVNTVPTTINQDMKALRCGASLDPQYLRDFFRGVAPYVVSLAEASAHGTRKLDSEVLGRLEVPVPPPAEQQRIATYIAEQSAKISSLEFATKTSIELLHERRASLIAAAVTGQLVITEPADRRLECELACSSTT